MKSIVICLVNPVTEDYVVSQFNDAAFLDRMARFSFAPSLDEWLDHAEANDVSDAITATAKKLKNMIVQNFPKENFEVTPSNRTFTRLGILMNNIEQEWLDKYGDLLASAYVGQEYAIAIMKEQKKLLDKTLEAKDVLKNFTKHREWLSKQAERTNYESGKFQGININLKRYIAQNFDEVMEKQKVYIPNLVGYLNILGDDQCLEFMQSLKEELSRGESGLSAERQSELLFLIDIQDETLYSRIKGEQKAKETT